jgi:L-seryl-tRNA(Ser) seleniumtransferase
VGRGEAAGLGLRERLRALPSVESLAARLDVDGVAHGRAVAAARAAIAARREELSAGGAGGASGGTLAADELLDRARELLAAWEAPSLRRVLNATGVIVHTNLGRAPLAAAARAAVARVAEGYGNLELELESGARGSRHAHVEALLCELTGAEAAIVVNNCAAATLLCAAALGGPGRSIVVSRGQLVEIGGGFRVPDVIAQAGARLVEVGTTNRTRLADYARALEENADAGAVLRVHPSNFRTLGFVEEVAIEPLCELGAPVIDDVGSGVLADELPLLADEPPLRRSVRAGAALVCCSGDKLLGGPQAGLVVGRAEAVARARAHPLARAVRIDKLSLAALEATLRLYRDPAAALRAIPVLAMLVADEATLAARAERLRAAAGTGEIVRVGGKVGGGALPLLELEGPAVAVGGAGGAVAAEALAAALRAADPPVVGRIHDGRLLLDPRTLTDDEAELAGAALRAALATADVSR